MGSRFIPFRMTRNLYSLLGPALLSGPFLTAVSTLGAAVLHGNASLADCGAGMMLDSELMQLRDSSPLLNVLRLMLSGDANRSPQREAVSGLLGAYDHHLAAMILSGERPVTLEEDQDVVAKERAYGPHRLLSISIDDQRLMSQSPSFMPWL